MKLHSEMPGASDYDKQLRGQDAILAQATGSQESIRRWQYKRPISLISGNNTQEAIRMPSKTHLPRPVMASSSSKAPSVDQYTHLKIKGIYSRGCRFAS